MSIIYQQHFFPPGHLPEMFYQKRAPANVSKYIYSSRNMEALMASSRKKLSQKSFERAKNSSDRTAYLCESHMEAENAANVAKHPKDTRNIMKSAC